MRRRRSGRRTTFDEIGDLHQQFATFLPSLAVLASKGENLFKFRSKTSTGSTSRFLALQKSASRPWNASQSVSTVSGRIGDCTAAKAAASAIALRT